MAGEFIDKIYGRDDLSLVLADGKLLLPSSIANIYSRILYELKSNKVKDTKIIQHNLSNIEIQIVIDKTIKEKEPSRDQILDVIKNGFLEKVGSNVKIDIKVVENIKSGSPRIISKVDKGKYQIKNYI